MVVIPTASRHLRWLVILYGIITLIWLGQEDSGIWRVVVLGISGTLLNVTLWLLNRLGGKQIAPITAVVTLALMGVASGAGSAATIAALMLFKNVQHAHAFPDYPFEMIGAMLSRAPLWALAGGFIGIALALLWSAFIPLPEQTHPTESSD